MKHALQYCNTNSTFDAMTQVLSLDISNMHISTFWHLYHPHHPPSAFGAISLRSHCSCPLFWIFSSRLPPSLFKENIWESYSITILGDPGVNRLYFQSGFRPGYCHTHMADLWWMQNGNGTFILVLLALLGFDTIDHGILLGWPRQLEIGGTVLWWFTSFFWS